MDIDLQGPWAGWRLRGRYLIAPDRQRLSVERLHGIVLAEFVRKTFAPKPVCRGVVSIDQFCRKVEALRADEASKRTA